jgi:hypothetical protein
MSDADKLRASRIKLALMFLLPILAVGLATLVFYTGFGLPKSTINKGELVQPPRQLDDIRVSTGTGEEWGYAQGDHDWSLLVVNSGACAERCRERLYLTRQIRVALGRDADRVSRLFIQLDPAGDADFAAFVAEQHPDLELLRADAGELKGLLGQAGDPDPVAEQPIYIVDQRGFVMMRYLARHSGHDTIADLRFLLKYSNEKTP